VRRPAAKDRLAGRPRPKVRNARRLPVVAPGPAIPCLSCSLCCGYVAVEIDGPSTLRGATEILWYLYHPGVSVYVDEGEWMVQFETRCQHLMADKRCGIYETRPPICREYDEVGCEVNAEVIGQALYSPREFLAYVAQHHKRIYSLIQRRYMPPEESLDGRVLMRSKLEPFRPRYEALRVRRQRVLR
jgi:Fe-S-cluster containining protein